jgi:nucleoside-diphosphate-sugar epimerase
MLKRVLVTGHRGYIGAVMAPWLRERGYDVVGLDTEYFGPECSFPPESSPMREIRKDLRDLAQGDLDGFDAVVHLAALCNDPLGSLQADLTYDINHAATVELARLAKKAGVQRFLFSSSCSMHGASFEAKVTEETPVNPLTPYGASKIRAEEDLRRLANDDFSPVFLRNGTVYGPSPRLRLDIVLNNLTGWACTIGRVKMLSDGSPWRPVIHVEDVCLAFQNALEAPRDRIHNDVFHVGANKENYQIRDLAEIVRREVGCEVEFGRDADADARTYIADFTKIEQRLGFVPRWTAATGVKQLMSAYRSAGLSAADMTGDRYIRLNRIRRLLGEGRLDESLRWARRPIETGVR